MVILSSEESLQETIREVKELIKSEQLEDAIRSIEEKSLALEKQEKHIESIILWRFLADTMEEREEEEYFAYALAKLITRYLYVEEEDKAKEVYAKASAHETENFYLSTAKALFERRMDSFSKREVVQVKQKDIFGDYNDVLASPNILFDSLTQIKVYASENLSEGTYLVHIFNHNLDATEEIEVSTEKTEEYQVISIDETVRID